MSGRCRFADKIYEESIEAFGVPESVIELGCGCGLNLKKFSESRRVGVDPFEPNIVAARKNVPEADLYLDCHHKLDDFADNEFDLGFTCSVLDHIENYEPALDNLIRICKNLYILEPYIEGENRQSTDSETRSSGDTWYWDYPKVLKSKRVTFAHKPSPLYENDSGPFYHTFFIRS
jgi:hypothetical protein